LTRAHLRGTAETAAVTAAAVIFAQSLVPQAAVAFLFDILQSLLCAQIFQRQLVRVSLIAVVAWDMANRRSIDSSSLRFTAHVRLRTFSSSSEVTDVPIGVHT
jgi:hypothetical protein